MLDIKKPELFISAETGVAMSIDSASLSADMPTLVPKGVDAEVM
jgi:hypothetical protein